MALNCHSFPYSQSENKLLGKNVIRQLGCSSHILFEVVLQKQENHIKASIVKSESIFMLSVLKIIAMPHWRNPVTLSASVYLIPHIIYKRESESKVQPHKKWVVPIVRHALAASTWQQKKKVESMRKGKSMHQKEARRYRRKQRGNAIVFTL